MACRETRVKPAFSRLPPEDPSAKSGSDAAGRRGPAPLYALADSALITASDLRGCPANAGYTIPAIAAPAIGAIQNSHSWATAQPPTKSAGPVLRAGFTERFVTGMP